MATANPTDTDTALDVGVRSAHGQGLTVGVLTETAPREFRVALDPSAVARLVHAKRTVLVESGAGVAASFSDHEYEGAGAAVVARPKVISSSSILAVVRPPDSALAKDLKSGQVVLGLLDPLNNLDTIATMAKRGLTLVAFELLPRTLSRAQSMDALSSQSSAAGYRAAIVAAESFGRYLSMMITASGTATPAKVMVIGTGVAGLQAIATARRLGAMVTGYDVRPSSRGEVESLGAKFLTSSVSAGAAAGGYARPITAEEKLAQEVELSQALTGFDIIITTAKVPGHIPPLLVSSATLRLLRPGTVCVDLGSSDKGGNVAGSVEGRRIVTDAGVVIIGAGDLASELPTSASQMYAKNVIAVIDSLAPENEIIISPGDEVHQNIVVSFGGQVTNAAVRAALKLGPLPHDLRSGSPEAA